MRPLLLLAALGAGCEGPAPMPADTDPPADSDDTPAETEETPGETDDTPAESPSETDGPVVDTPDDTGPTVVTCPPPTVVGPRTVTRDDPAVAAAVDGLSTFGWRLYREVADDTDGNVMLSPFSVGVALGLLQAGAEGVTQSELDTLLGVSADEVAWRQALGRLVADLDRDGAQGTWRARVANRVWGQQGVGWETAFLDATEDDWGAPTALVDFAADPAGVRADINDWVEERTCGLIPDLLPVPAVTAATVMALVNALFVEGAWLTPFEGTTTAPFTRADGGAVNTEFLIHPSYQVETVRDGAVEIAHLRVQEGDLGFWGVLPDDPAGLAAVEATLDAATFDGWAAAATADRREVWLPRLDIGAPADLVAPLTDLGLQTPWMSLTADLSGMNPMLSLFVSAVQHEARLQTFEEGFRAAAATAVVVSNDSGAAPAEPLRFDRPFLFVIRDERTGALLFVGRIADPS